MFTGIIAGTGRVTALQHSTNGLRFSVSAGALARGMRRGESISVSGACLTILRNRNRVLTFHAMPETLRKTRLGALRVGDRVNLERPLRATDRISGHFVQGHVDALGTVRRVRAGADYRIAIDAPPAVARYLIPKGSVAVDGVSLTIAALREPAQRRRHGRLRSATRAAAGLRQSTFEVALIPETLQRTTLYGLRAGDRVHLEADMLGKYIHRLLRKGP